MKKKFECYLPAYDVVIVLDNKPGHVTEPQPLIPVGYRSLSPSSHRTTLTHQTLYKTNKQCIAYRSTFNLILNQIAVGKLFG